MARLAIGRSCPHLLGATVWLISLTQYAALAQAQPIVPANDGTGTQVNLTGNQFDITGGQRSRDGANLFHSFQRFGLNTQQIANFLADPNLRNILGRVVGGEASQIDGLLQIVGGNANLYLMNPAGIIFGTNARLNVPAAFTATTASGIGIGTQWFNAIGNHDYAALIGTPHSFAFTMSQPGSIINAGHLAVTQGQNLTLLAGTIISTGTLTAPGGQMTVATVPGTSLVRLSQSGNPLSLEIQPIQPSAIANLAVFPFEPLSLPQLLTGGTVNHATGITLGPTGEVILTGSGLRIEAGDLMVRSTIAQSTTLSASHNLTLVASQLQTTHTLNLLAEQTVQIRDSATVPFVAQAGGDLTIQGKNSIDILALAHPITPFVSGGNLTLISNGTIAGDAHFASGGHFVIRNLAGEPGHFVSLYDPIIRSNSNVTLGNYTGAALKVEAVGSITTGNITITSPDLASAIPTTDPDFTALTTRRALILRAGLLTVEPPLLVGDTPDFTPTAPTQPATITTGNLNTSSLEGSAGSIVLSAPGTIQTGTINSVSDGTVPGDSGAVTLNSQNGAIATGTIISFKGTGTQPGNGGNVTLTAQNDITVNGTAIDGADNGAINAGSGGQGKAGTVTLSSRNGVIAINGDNASLRRVLARSDDGDGGAVNFTARNNILTGNVETASTQNGSGGRIALTSDVGTVTTGNLNSTGTVSGGAISLNAPVGSVTTGSITLGSPTRNGDELSVNAAQTIDLSAGITANGANLSLGGQTTPDTLLLPATINTGGGDFSLRLNRDFNLTSAITTAGGDVSLTSAGRLATSGAIQTQGGNINLSGTSLTTATLNTGSNPNGGAIDLTATNGDLTTGDLTTSSTSGSGGALTMTASLGAISSSNLTTSGVSRGGAVTISARDRITTGAINSSATVGNGGNVTLDPEGDIQVSSINAQGGTTGQGGNVDITTERFFRATDRFSDRNGSSASISTAGGDRGGSIIIRHGGGIQNTPFTVGQASVNGTVGAITTGTENTIFSGSFPGIYQQGRTPSDIQLVTLQLEAPPQSDIWEQLSLDELLSTFRLNRNSILPEERYTREHELMLGIQGTRIKTLEAIQQELIQIEQAVGIKPAIIYTVFVPEFLTYTNTPDHFLTASSVIQITPQESDQLALILVTAKGKVIGRRIAAATRAKVRATAQAFLALNNQKFPLEPATRSEAETITRTFRSIGHLTPNSYLKAAQQLYQWLVTPLKPDLDREQVNNLVYIMDSGLLRSLPLAALHNGQQFLIEEYSVSLMPSMSLTDTRYVNLRNVQVLAMGAEIFQRDQAQTPLPFAPVESSIITPILWQGEVFLNQAFTLAQFDQQRNQQRYGIVHLATHAEFDQANPASSYLQFWDERLDFQKLRQLNLSKPPVELMALSACQTAIGSEFDEFGIAGLSIQLGVKSSLASLWNVDDLATFMLMTQFYHHLNQSIIKAEALRQAQLAMLNQQHQIILTLLEQQDRTAGSPLIDPKTLADTLKIIQVEDFSHPYYWAGFTLVGNPW